MSSKKLQIFLFFLTICVAPVFVAYKSYADYLQGGNINVTNSDFGDEKSKVEPAEDDSDESDDSINPLTLNGYNFTSQRKLKNEGFDYDPETEIFTKNSKEEGVIMLKFYDNKLVERQRKIIDRDKEEYREYHENGILKFIQTYKREGNKWKIYGFTRMYYNNGVLYIKGGAKNGIPEGETAIYDRNGTRTRTEWYEGGRLISTVEHTSAEGGNGGAGYNNGYNPANPQKEVSIGSGNVVG
jgi:antitoxin component YwqK of YwqJK toxin-antitoxin module